MILRWCEYLLIFWLVPLVLFIYRQSLAPLAVPIVLSFGVICSYWLWHEGILQKHWKKAKKLKRAQLKPLLYPFVIIALMLMLLALFLVPEKLFYLPIEMPEKWLLLLLVYPLFSVVPQELIFRTYFFHRYKKLFSHKYLRALLTSIAFAFAHVIYGNWVAVVLAFFGSLLFSFRFIASKSTALVIIEHSAIGLYIFTIGLGYYFVAPAII